MRYADMRGDDGKNQQVEIIEEIRETFRQQASTDSFEKRLRESGKPVTWLKERTAKLAEKRRELESKLKELRR